MFQSSAYETISPSFRCAWLCSALPLDMPLIAETRFKATLMRAQSLSLIPLTFTLSSLLALQP